MISRLIELVSFALSHAFDELEADWLDVRREVAFQLEAQGFDPEEIEIALDVAGRIRENLESEATLAEAPRTNMIYRQLEELKLTPAARGHLLSLVNEQRITPQQREAVIERCLGIESNEPVDIDLIRGIVNWVISGDDGLEDYLVRTLH